MDQIAVRPLAPHLWYAQSTTFATNAGLFLVGSWACLIDPGIAPAELDRVAAFVAAHGARVRAIILTHAHWDHLLGPSRFPDAVIVAHVRYREVVKRHEGDLVRQVARWRAEAGLPAAPFVPPVPTYTFTHKLTLRHADVLLEVIAAPGHAPDHCVAYAPEARALWAGDMLSDREIPMVMGGVETYHDTLTRLAALKVEILVPGHGTPTTDRSEIQARFDRDQAYLAALQACVGGAVARGATLAETVDDCSTLPFAQPDAYPNAPRWNVEQAFLELGGVLQPDAVDAPVGWIQDWL